MFVVEIPLTNVALSIRIDNLPLAVAHVLEPEAIIVVTVIIESNSDAVSPSVSTMAIVLGPCRWNRKWAFKSAGPELSCSLFV